MGVRGLELRLKRIPRRERELELWERWDERQQDLEIWERWEGKYEARG
jgi:hypothetical protein